MSNGLVAVSIALVVLAALGWLLYRPAVQQSEAYRAMVVPLANIMDVGFIVLSPVIVVLSGWAAPLVMLAICLAAIAMGLVIGHNIRHYEPIEGSGDSLERVERVAVVTLACASVVNIAYYTLLLVTLLLWPLELYSPGRVTVVGGLFLAALLGAGWAGQIDRLNDLGNRATAFNLAAVFSVLVAFAVFNLQEALGGRWSLPRYDVTLDAESARKIVGLFALVQGFEAARYIGSRFAAGVRITTMRAAQGVSTFVFVALLASSLLLYGQVQPNPSGDAIFVLSDRVGGAMPWLILMAAIGSQTSAIVNATSSQSDMLISLRPRAVPRPFTFPLLLVPAILLVVFTDVNQSVALASRVFAAYFVIQCVLAAALARRRRAWSEVVGIAVVGLGMGAILVFGIPS